MEIELKFLVEDELVKDRILNDGHLLSMAESDTPEVIPMRAIYLDTEEYSMLKKTMAFRVRYEGERPVATLKWGGKSENGLHERGELNVSVDEEYVKEPHMGIFKGSEIYEEIAETVGDKPLIPVMEMEFIRKEVHVDTGKSISVVSYDEGEIRTSNGTERISELEVELYSGSQEDMIALGRELATKYNLKAGEKSKFKRGIELLGI